MLSKGIFGGCYPRAEAHGYSFKGAQAGHNLIVGVLSTTITNGWGAVYVQDALQELALNGYIGEPTVSSKHREKFNLGAGTGRRSKRHNGKANARVPKA